MSDFQQPGPASLPPPSMAPPVSPFGVPQAPPAPQFGGYPGPTSWSTAGYVAAKPPRPAVRAGSVMLICSGVGLVLGSILNWITIDGTSMNGFSNESLNLDGDSPGGGVFVFFAVLLTGFGIAQFAARKVLAVAILAVVFASFALMVALAEMSDVSDALSLTRLFGAQGSWGPGVPVLVVSSLLGLGGGIATLAKRRR